MSDLTAQTVVLVPGVGTTTLALWPENQRPARTLEVANIDEWLLTISANGAIGVTPQSTAAQHPHPGVRYIRLTDAPVVRVSLVAPRARPHPAIAQLADIVRRCAAAGTTTDL